MAAYWFCVADNSFKLFYHLLSDADIIELNRQPECPGRVGHLPPFLERHAVAQRFNHTPDGGDGAFALVDPESITDRLAFLCF
ncbi:Uncharacterised protein [Klebsiella pneumoniae]|nr:Uncharacterised protein [Klebsiella pneumoniae]